MSRLSMKERIELLDNCTSIPDDLKKAYKGGTTLLRKFASECISNLRKGLNKEQTVLLDKYLWCTNEALELEKD